MHREPSFDKNYWAVALIQGISFILAIGFITSWSIAAEDDIAEQKAHLQSLLPQHAKPSPTAEQSERGFIAYWAPPTTNFYSNFPPAPQDLSSKAVIRTFAGEDEPLLLGVWGLRDMNYAAVWLTKPVFEMTVGVPQSTIGALSLPHSMGEIEIPAWVGPDAPQKVRQDRNVFFWINVHVPKGTAPGTYQGQITLTVSESLGQYLSKPGGWSNVSWKQDMGSWRVELPFTVQVLPVNIPRADIAYGMYFRGLEGRRLPPDYLTEQMRMGYYRDMARHGHTSTYLEVHTKLHHGDGSVAMQGLPRPEPGYVLEEGQTRGAYYDELPEISFVKKMQMMMDSGLLSHDVPMMISYAFGPTSYDDHEAVGRFAANLRAEFDRRGWPEPLRYGPDEPTSTGPLAPAYRDAFKGYALTQPGQRLVTAIAPEEVEAFADDLDVWIVLNRGENADSVMNEVFQDLQRMAAEHDAKVWAYYMIHLAGNPQYHRYYAGLFTWAHRLKGNYLWCYAEYHTWEGNRGSDNFNLVLPSKAGPVPSVAWEVRREGIEDYRILRQLERLCQDKAGPKATAARAWLDKLRQRVVGAAIKTGPFVSRKKLVDNIAPQFARGEFSQLRSQAIDMLVDLDSE